MKTNKIELMCTLCENGEIFNEKYQACLDKNSPYFEKYDCTQCDVRSECERGEFIKCENCNGEVILEFENFAIIK